MDAERTARTLSVLTETLPSCAACGSAARRNRDRSSMITTSLQTSMNSVTNLRDALSCLSQAGLTEEALARSGRCWLERPSTVTSSRSRTRIRSRRRANNGGPWTTWLALGGRGAGKTRLGAEFVRALALGLPPYADAPHGAIALVGETAHDVREVMIEGAVRPHARGAVARAAGVVADARAARMEQRRGRAGVLGRGSGELARAAVRCRLVRRAREVAARGRRLRHAAVRPAARRAPAPAHHHDAAPDRADQAADRRPAHRGDARARRRRTPRISRPRFLPRWWRATRARGSAARRFWARSSRTAPTRCGRAP